MSIALNRHHKARIKRNRRYYWGRDLSTQPKALGKCARTPKPCHCLFCINPRRYQSKTMQELRMADALQDGLKQVNE